MAGARRFATTGDTLQAAGAGNFGARRTFRRLIDHARRGLLAGLLLLVAAASARAGDAERGYELLINQPYLPPDFDQQTFDAVWQVWPEPLRKEAAAATPDERRRLAFQRYGLTERPGESSGQPLQYVVDESGQWSMNCFACHGGRVAGEVVPGAPNSLFDLQTLTEEIRATKLRHGKPLGRMDLGAFIMPLSGNLGTTNAVMFGVALKAARDAELNVTGGRPERMVHHDMDAPPWWHYRQRERLYIDGFAEKGHRALMQFLLVRENGPEKFRQWEDDYRHIHAYMESLEAPRWPWPIDRSLAEAGERVFVRHCAECHGTYGEQPEYPQRVVPLSVVGTDPVRLEALTAEHRRQYARSWFAHFGADDTVEEPGGYLAPPLDGVWASAPYFHNGSVPTLWHVLHPDQRPVVWTRRGDGGEGVGHPAAGYDRERVGLAVRAYERVPPEVARADERRRFFDTRGFGKSAAGHRFPERLTLDQRRALLEYLKSL